MNVPLTPPNLIASLTRRPRDMSIRSCRGDAGGHMVPNQLSRATADVRRTADYRMFIGRRCLLRDTILVHDRSPLRSTCSKLAVLRGLQRPLEASGAEPRQRSQAMYSNA